MQRCQASASDVQRWTPSEFPALRRFASVSSVARDAADVQHQSPSASSLQLSAPSGLRQIRVGLVFLMSHFLVRLKLKISVVQDARRAKRKQFATFRRIRNCCAICPNIRITRNTLRAALRRKSSPSATLTCPLIRASCAISSAIRTTRNTATRDWPARSRTPSATFRHIRRTSATSQSIRTIRSSRPTTWRRTKINCPSAPSPAIRCFCAITRAIPTIRLSLIRNSPRRPPDPFAPSRAIRTTGATYRAIRNTPISCRWMSRRRSRSATCPTIRSACATSSRIRIIRNWWAPMTEKPPLIVSSLRIRNCYATSPIIPTIRVTWRKATFPPSPSATCPGIRNCLRHLAPSSATSPTIQSTRGWWARAVRSLCPSAPCRTIRRWSATCQSIRTSRTTSERSASIRLRSATSPAIRNCSAICAIIPTTRDWPATARPSLTATCPLIRWPTSRNSTSRAAGPLFRQDATVPPMLDSRLRPRNWTILWPPLTDHLG